MACRSRDHRPFQPVNQARKPIGKHEGRIPASMSRENPVMYARSMVIAATALTMAASAVAEPVQPVAREAAQPASQSKPVLLASAEQIRAPGAAADQAAPAPVKRPRVARVTTCRCGDPEQH